MKTLPIQIAVLICILSGCQPDTAKKEPEVSSLPSSTSTSTPIKVNAKPDSIDIDFAKTAVIVVDMENDFCSKGGLMDKVGVDVSGIQTIVGPTKKVLEAAHNAGLPIIYLKMGFESNLSDLGAHESSVRKRFYGTVGDSDTLPNGDIGRFLIRDTWNTGIIPELKPQANDIVIYKTRFSGFHRTKLDNVLRRLNIKYLIMTGCTTSVCVESTVRDAMFRDYISVVVEDCTAEPDGQEFSRSNHEASLFIMQSEFGWVAYSGELIEAMGRASQQNN